MIIIAICNCSKLYEYLSLSFSLDFIYNSTLYSRHKAVVRIASAKGGGPARSCQEQDTRLILFRRRRSTGRTTCVTLAHSHCVAGNRARVQWNNVKSVFIYTYETSTRAHARARQILRG